MSNFSFPSFHLNSYKTNGSRSRTQTPTMNRRLARNLEDNASTNLFRDVNFFKRFAIKFMDMKKFRPSPNQPFINLPNSNTTFQYEGSPMQHVGKDKMASIHRFVERLHRQENTDELRGKTHHYALMKGGGIGSMKLHVTFISKKKDGQLSFRRKYVDIRSQSGKVGFMPEKQHRQEAYSILFPNNMMTNGTLQANSHQKNLCAWAIPSSDYKTVYMISHNVLFNGPCVPDSKNMNHYRMTREAPVLLAFLGVKIHYGSTREARLLRFVLKSASNRGSIVKSKIIMAKPKLRALVGNHIVNATPNHNNYHKALVIHSMYSNAQKTQKQRAQAQRNKRKRNQNNGKAGPSRRPRQ